MVEIENKYKIYNKKFGYINWIGLWTLYKKEVLRFLIVVVQTVISPLVTSLLFLLVLSLDKNNRILQFIEKPNLPDSEYRLVNAGIYFFYPEKIFKYINEKDDFGYDVFPKLLKNGYKFFGLRTDSNLYTIDTPIMYKNVKSQLG